MTDATNGGWTITERGFDPQTHKSFEGLFTLGGPGLHVRGSLEEPVGGAPQDLRYWRSPANVTAEVFREKVSKWGTFIPGVYGPHPLLNNELINLPCGLGMSVVVGGERLCVRVEAGEGDAAGGVELPGHERTLDLRRATLRRHAVWRTRAGAEITVVEHERFVHQTRPGLLVQRMVVRADRDVEVVIEAGIDGRVTTNGYDHFVRVECSLEEDGGAARCEVETDSVQRVVVRARLAGPGEALEPVIEERAVTVRQRVLLRAGETAVFEKVTAYRVGAEALGRGGFPELALGALLAEHERAWDERWATCDVEIGGDPESQLAVRAALFHLLRAHPGPDSALAIDAKGYAGEAYWGRFFWDTEMFLLPFFCATDPARARALVDYRIRTLPAARESARRRGGRGARFAWEADADGRECCPNFQFADHEVHITADVAYGAALFAAAGKNRNRGPLAELLIETGRFWMSRIDRRPGDNLPHLLGVMGPDEYTMLADDNAYTNRLARFNLALAAEALEAQAAREAAEGAGGPGAEAAAAEGQEMRDVAAGLPYARAPGGLILQCEGFDRLPDPRFDELWTDGARPFAANVPQEWLYRSRCLKQADVLMLMALFPHEFRDDEVRAAWYYYLPLTTHDSSLSPAVHALIATRLGLDDEAWRFWQRGSGLDLDVARGGGGGAAEGIHIAAAGGVWLMVMGFAGLQSPLWTDTLTLAPRLPRQWGRLGFLIVWRGQRARVSVEREGGGARAVVENRSDRPLAVEVWGERRDIAPGSEGSFRTGGTPAPPAASPAPGVRAVIFDLDGVLVTTDELHFRAWKAVADAEDVPFTREDNHRLRGVSRMRSLEILLEKAPRSYSEQEKLALAKRKNARYIESLAAIGPEAILPGAIDTLRALRARGVRVAVASSSRNARTIIARLGLGDLLDAVVDGGEAEQTKPAPDLFLLAAARLGARPGECVVIEDAEAGVEAAARAQMPVIAIGAAAGDGRARLSARSLEELTPGQILGAV
jgi:beta-phosphoglucomutase